MLVPSYYKKSRQDFLASLREALIEEKGLAAGKFGFSEQAWTAFPFRLNEIPSSEQHSLKTRAVTLHAQFHAGQIAGVFPQNPDFLQDFSRTYTEIALKLDFVACAGARKELELLDRLGLGDRALPFDALEPNRSQPYDPLDCYLPSLTGRRVLLITTPAQLLSRRANKETFERVWQKIGIPWFEPAGVDALAIPWLWDKRTRIEYEDIWALRDYLDAEIRKRDFDIALIAASSLGIPIAVGIKDLGKVGISLGGHLQVLFGVSGKRWNELPNWEEMYVTDEWIHMPAEYRPEDHQKVGDNGAYW